MEEMQYEEIDVKIVLSIKNPRNKARYVYVLVTYNLVINFFTKLFQFIFIFLPAVILFPIWGLTFDIYRKIMAVKLKDFYIAPQEDVTDGEQGEDKGN